jgi:tetratricopeptide (TPR) repeat protein
MGTYEKAIDYYTKSISIYIESNNENNPLTATTYNNLGSVYASKGDYDKAIECYNKSIKIKLITLGVNDLSLAKVYNNMGSALDAKGEYNNAIEYYNKSLTIYGESHPLSANLLNNIAGAYKSKGENEKAIDYYNKSISIHLLTNGDSPDIAMCYHNLGSVYDSNGEYDTAIEYYNKSLSIFLNTENQTETAWSYNSLGGAYASKGEYDKSIQYINKSISIRSKINLGNNPDTAMSYLNLGSSYEGKGDYDKAIEYYNKSISIYINTIGKNHPDISNCYAKLGSIYMTKGEVDKAVEFNNKSFAIRMKTLGENHPSVAASYNDFGLAYLEKGEYDKAIEYFNKAIKIIANQSDRIGYLTSLINLKDVYLAQKNTQAEINVLKQITELVLKNRQSMGKDKDFFTEKFIFNFHELFQIYTQKKDYEKAFEISEKMRGLSIMEDMNLKYALKSINFSEEKRDSFLDLRKKIQGLYSERAVAIQKGEKGLESSDKLWKQIIYLQNKADKIEKEFYRNSEYTKLREFIPPSISLLQNKLKISGQTFLEYNLINKDGKEELHVFVITSDSFTDLKLGTDTDLSRKVTNLRKIISQYPTERNFIVLKNRDGKEILCTFGECKGFKKGKEYSIQEIDFTNSFKEDGKIKYTKKLIGIQERKIKPQEAYEMMDSYLKEIYSIILKPIAKAGLLNSKSLVISPDSILFTIPFSALKDDNGNYLVENFEISLIHSASIWERLVRKEELKFTKPLFAIGNSIYALNHSDTISLSGKRNADESRSVSELNRLDDIKLNNLPGSLEEIKEISKIAYNIEIEPNHIYLGIRANKDELYKCFEHPKEIYKSVHFSVHGLFYMNSPELNSLALTSRERAEKFKKEELDEYEKKNGRIVRDGFFKLGETIELGIQTDLFVMSACETSLGTEKAGEGVVGLPQGILMGGASNVLATLWSVDDKGTMNFMKEFYLEYLNKNTSSTKSLRNTQILLFPKNGKYENYSDPFYWSAFVVYGK